MAAEYASQGSLTELSRLQFSKFLNVAALAVYVFDYCLTFSSEVEYVWGTKWEVTRILFTLSRYLAFISASLTCYDVLANEGCGNSVLALDVMYIASVLFAELILILRTWALWGRSKKVLLFLLSLASVSVACSEVVSLKIKIFLPGDSASPYQFYPSLCAYGTSRNAVFQYSFLLGYEIFLQSMSTWRKFRTYRKVQSRTLNTLYWDGIMYMWWIILLGVGNIAVMASAPIVYIPALDTGQVVIHGLLASRIFFNLRQCDKEVYSHGEALSLETMQYRARSTVGAATQLTQSEA